MRTIVHVILILLLSTSLDMVRAQVDDPKKMRYARFMGMDGPTSAQLDSMIELSIIFSYTNKDSCLTLGERAVELSSESADRLTYAKALIELGDSYRIFDDLVKAEELLVNGKAICEQLGDVNLAAMANNKLGALMKNRGDNQAAIDYYLQALETWENLKDTQNLIKPYINIGAVFMSISRPLRGIEYNEKAYELAEMIGDDRAKGYVANNMAIIYSNRAMKLKSIADTIGKDAELYLDSADSAIENALSNYSRSLVLSMKKEDLIGELRVLGNMADLKAIQGRYEEALELMISIDVKSRDSGATLTQLRHMTRYSRILRLNGDHKGAIKYGEEALRSARELGLERDIAEASNELYKAYKEVGNMESALECLEDFKAYTDKNGDLERNKAIAEVESRYQNVQKEKKILEQENNILALESAKAAVEKQRNYMIGGGLVLSLLLFFGFQLNRIRKERNDKIAFAEALIFAQEEERKRIARDLHDGVGQSLLLIKKQMDATKTTVRENQELISHTLEEVRSISRDLHPFQLQKFGLTSAIEGMIEKVSDLSEIFMTKDLSDVDGVFGEKQEIHVYRAIQEALNNIIKHSRASAAKVSIVRDKKEVRIQIQDNGVGFDIGTKDERSKSLGLRTMSERISAIGGTFEIEKGKPKGTVVRIHIPTGS